MEKQQILSDRMLTLNLPDVRVVTVSPKTLKRYEGDPSVAGVVGSRAMARMTAEMHLPSLKLVQLTSAGFEGVPVASLEEKGVTVCNAGDVYAVPMAETVVLGMLMMAKKLRKNPNNRLPKLTRHYTAMGELFGKQGLILGVGNIGTAVAERLAGFGMELDGYDPYCGEKPQLGVLLRTRKELLENLSKYDYLISTLPDTPETKGFLNRELFERMKPTAVVVNVGRRTAFSEADFYQALKRRQLGGAVLDMFEKLPNPITNPFRRLSNTVVLPSVSAISKEGKERLRVLIQKNLEAVLSGKEPTCIIHGGNR